ncbi:hypothetical protein BD626DRAFT_563246 [Schizophyllum amplum]|uniref:Uncharacterized protein n=1 Tax=Schizophyllum amplum TaxID=97359 RepID=A0A550CXH6_9AGAR|nr:hypothetical protein BD626DRAFT_563246 [Auriculariopsis ampla]
MSGTLLLTVEDSSPLVSYNPEGAWKDGEPSDSSSYSGNSYHYTGSKGAYASISFNGTGISIYGANGPDYGPYSIYVDNTLVGAGNGKTPTMQTKALLGTVTGLEVGAHTVDLMNNSDALLDVDWAVLATDLNTDGVSVDDRDGGVEYHPSAEWATSDTEHTTESLEVAYAALSFYGDAIAVYGTASPDHARAQALVDGQVVQMAATNGTELASAHSGVLIYFMTGLPTAQHSLKIEADPDSSGKSLAIDAIHIYSSSGAASVANWKPAGDDALPLGIILGAGVAGGLVALVLIGLLVHFLRKRRKRRARQSEPEPTSPELPFQIPTSTCKPFSIKTTSHSRWSDETLAFRWQWKKDGKGKGKNVKTKIPKAKHIKEKDSLPDVPILTPMMRRAFSPASLDTLRSDGSYASNLPILYRDSPTGVLSGTTTPLTATFSDFSGEQYPRQLTVSNLLACIDIF